MLQLTEKDILSVVENFQFPLLGETYGTLDAIESIAVNDNVVDLCLRMGFKTNSQNSATAVMLENDLEAAGVNKVNVRIINEVLPSPTITRQGNLRDVKNILMVASGKGGVGKSTTAINLALALQREGAKVGILDADIYGPSMRTMLGIAKDIKPKLIDQKTVEPIKKFGLKSMSVAYMSEEKTPMIWRGPMAVRALQQLLEMTLWGELDYLVIDMPPGTGDIHISLAQKIQVSAAVVVTTPQEMALIDARKGVEMFNKVSIPVLGIVENMATHICSQCGHQDAIFGGGGAQQLADQYGIRLLGSLPLHGQIRADVDAGMPTVLKDPMGTLAQAYLSLANRVSAELWRVNLQAKSVPILHIVD